uniref:Ribokinase-like isoform X1 n=1 Tax=Tanacetum cinerariifolium TaxID=118510 RepID=A0A6L2NX07_TANCI|nr:ribokinase-like isoform X1 [Tanacetum cinerariifolium]GEU89899.1 ribokinase-like isoform X1 [Tanacetum cinerariifolium]
MTAIYSTTTMLSNFISSSSSSSRSIRSNMTSSASNQLDNPTVLGFGGVSVDLLATVASFPNPDDKIRSTSMKVQGGGNAGNALTCAARLGLNARLMSKVANDAQGRGVLEELQADGVDVSYFVVSEDGNSPFTYVIVDNQTKTRTCIHTPGSPPMIPTDLKSSTLLSALEGVKLCYFDLRLHETALVVANEANRRSIPILIDAERIREGLDDFLNLSDYVVCSSNLPQAWTGAPTIPSALVSMLLKLPKVKFVIVTLGADGCIMLERNIEDGQVEEMDVDNLLELLKQKIDSRKTAPTCVSSVITRLQAKGVGTVCGRLFFGTAEKIPGSELVDTTGAGDAFIGAILYAICTDKPPEEMLPFAAQVAAVSCRDLGARTGLPNISDPRLAPFLVGNVIPLLDTYLVFHLVELTNVDGDFL